MLRATADGRSSPPYTVAGGWHASLARSERRRKPPMLKRTRLVPISLAGALLLATALTSSADPNLPDIRAHRHYVRNGSGERVEVGPRLCDNPNLQHAFNQFHANVHTVVQGAIGPVAPGLHNGMGAELEAGPC
jgi:hypothetical protein